MWIFFIYPVIILVNSICNTNAACILEDANKCIINFISESGLETDNFGFPLPFKDRIDPADYLKICGAKNRYTTCVTPVLAECDSGVTFQYQGFIDMFEHLCQLGADAFQRDGPCLGSEANRAFHKMCESNRNTDLTHDNWCRKYVEFLSCIGKGAKRSCGEDEAVYQYDVLSQKFLKQASDTYSCTLSNTDYFCTQTTLDMCYSNFITSAGLKKDSRGIPIPFMANSDTAALKTTCSAYQVFKMCSDFDTKCDDLSSQNTLEGVIYAFDYICGSGQSRYLTHNKCLGTVANTDAMTACLQQFYSGLNDDNWCQNAETLFECMKTTSTNNCDSGDAAFQDEIQRRLLISLSERYTCPVLARSDASMRLASLSVTLTTTMTIFVQFIS